MLLWVNPCGPGCRVCCSPTLPGPFPIPPGAPCTAPLSPGGSGVVGPAHCPQPRDSGAGLPLHSGCFAAPRLPATPCSVNIPPAAARPMCKPQSACPTSAILACRSLAAASGVQGRGHNAGSRPRRQQQGWPHGWLAVGMGSRVAGSPQPALTGCSSPHRWTATPR